MSVMSVQTFTAPTMAEVMRRVASALGADAIILNTRTLYRRTWLGLRRIEAVEVTAKGGQRPVVVDAPLVAEWSEVSGGVSVE